MTEDLNKEHALNLGWRPDWFGLPSDTWGEALAEAIKAFQREWCIIDDGICGPTTHLRLLLSQDTAICDAPQQTDIFPEQLEVTPSNSILVGGERKPIEWEHVITPDEPGALKLTKGFSKRKRLGKGVVVHWPVTYTPAATIKVLNSRKVGTHFEIGPPIGDEGKVTIYQYCDVSYRTFHAVKCNDFVGIDISSPVYAKESVLKKLKRLGHTERPIISGYTVNGWKGPDIIGYHENQLKALYALLAALHLHAGVVLKAPAHTGDSEVIKRAKSWNFIKQHPGVYHHAEVDLPRLRKDGKTRASGKWDTAGVDLKLACAEALTLT
jgi:hypothetical protein